MEVPKEYVCPICIVYRASTGFMKSSEFIWKGRRKNLIIINSQKMGKCQYSYPKVMKIWKSWKGINNEWMEEFKRFSLNSVFNPSSLLLWSTAMENGVNKTKIVNEINYAQKGSKIWCFFNLQSSILWTEENVIKKTNESDEHKHFIFCLHYI